MYRVPPPTHYGRQVRELPRGYHRYSHLGRSYYYYGGIFYLQADVGYSIVQAPIGFMLATLPLGFSTYYYGDVPYYYYMGTYYLWNEAASSFQVVEAPAEVQDQAAADQAAQVAGTEEASGTAETAQEQAPETQESKESKDRYECHLWAVYESKADPSGPNADAITDEQITQYNNSLMTCLKVRGYTIK